MRNVALSAHARCPRCALVPRWCICAAVVQIATDLQITLISHKREFYRSSSTGNLIKRLFPTATQHSWQPVTLPSKEVVINPHKEIWLLHPHGKAIDLQTDPANTQIILLDGSWSEVISIQRAVNNWGKLVQLPMTGPSRFWLRAKQDNERYSTAEALLFLLNALGLQREYDLLKTQFELHVYAHLRTRGKTALAAEFLDSSALQKTMPEIIAQLQGKQSSSPFTS